MGILDAPPVAAKTTRPPVGRRWCFLGTSITNGSTATNFAYSYSALAIGMLGSANARGDYIEAGTPGYTAASALAYLPSVLAAYPDIGGLVVELGKNDEGATSLSSYISTMTTIVAMAKAKGIPVVINTTPPRGAAVVTSPQRTSNAQFNAWVRLWAPANGCEVAEVHGALADPTTGDLPSAYDAGDGVHLTNLGHAKMAQPVAQAMKRLAGNRPLGATFAKMTGISLQFNPLMAGTLGAGAPSGWYENPGGSGTAPAYSMVADTTGLLPAGQWTQMDFTATAGGTRNFATGPGFTGVSVGDTLAATFLVHVEDLTGTWEADVVANTASVTPQVAKDSGVNIAKFQDRCPGLFLGNAAGTGNPVWQLGPAFTPFVIPASTTGLICWNNVTLPTGRHVKVRFGVIDYINLTALGLTSLVGGGAVVNISGP